MCRTQHHTFRATHGQQTAYRATFTSANVYRASAGRRFRKDKAVRSSYSKTRIMPQNADYAVLRNVQSLCVCDVKSCVGAWSNYYFL